MEPQQLKKWLTVTVVVYLVFPRDLIPDFLGRGPCGVPLARDPRGGCHNGNSRTSEAPEISHESPIRFAPIR